MRKSCVADLLLTLELHVVVCARADVCGPALRKSFNSDQQGFMFSTSDPRVQSGSSQISQVACPQPNGLRAILALVTRWWYHSALVPDWK